MRFAVLLFAGALSLHAAGSVSGYIRPRLQDSLIDVGVDTVFEPKRSGQWFYAPYSTIRGVARWRNHSTDTVSFLAYFAFLAPGGTLHRADTFQVPGIPPGDTVLLSTPSFELPYALGAWFLRCSTRIEGDVNHVNDTLSREFGVMIG